MGGDLGIGGCWVFGWVWGRYWRGVYIVLLKIGLVYLDLNLIIPLILVPLRTVPKFSSAHLMQFFKLIPIVQPHLSILNSKKVMEAFVFGNTPPHYMKKIDFF